MSPYRSPAPRTTVAPLPRRGFLDTARRLGLMWRRSQRWNFAGGWPELLCGVAPGALLLLVFRGAGWAWFAGALLINLVQAETGFTKALLGFLRAKRVRWLLGRDVPRAPDITCYPAIRIWRRVLRREITIEEGARELRRLREDDPC